MTVEERIAWQRAKMAAKQKAEAAAPAPNIVEDPVPPKRKPMSVQEVVAAFIEDRAYDIARDKRNERNGEPIRVIDAENVRSMSDVFAILTMEQPEEYMRVPKDGVRGKSFRTIGMDDVEIAQVRKETDDSMLDRMVASGEELRTETQPSSTNVSKVVAEVPRPTPTAIRPFAPPKQVPPPTTPAEQAAPSAPAGNAMKNRMLDAIRSHRRESLELMDE